VTGKRTKIRAAILEEMSREPPYAVSRPLTIEEIELAPPGRGEMLVRIAAAALCHSDLPVIDGSRPRPMPMALGHEASAVVVETGAEVDDVAKGDHVVLVFAPSCGQDAVRGERRTRRSHRAARPIVTGSSRRCRMVG
jgi:alcohol dehydrogenase